MWNDKRTTDRSRLTTSQSHLQETLRYFSSQSPLVDSFPLLLFEPTVIAAGAAFAAACNADSPMVTGMTTGELLFAAAESNDGVVVLLVEEIDVSVKN